MSSWMADKVYVVQTNQRIIERCLLMTTEPGDLMFDPTCGSGTTAYVAEKWGRRWITCDTSRVAVTLARQRLMTVGYEYYPLKYPQEGLKSGFIYKTVPHVTLKSIANNPEIDEIYEKLHPAIKAALATLNAQLLEADLSAQPSAQGRINSPLQEWEVPFDFPEDWPEQAQEPFAAFHAASTRRLLYPAARAISPCGCWTPTTTGVRCCHRRCFSRWRARKTAGRSWQRR